MPQKKVFAPVSILGDRYSLYVYLWHYPIGIFIGDILYIANAPDWTIDWCLPVVTIVVSIAVSAAIYHIKNSPKKHT